MEGKGRMKGMWLQHFLLQKLHGPGVPFISRRSFCPHKASPAWHQPAEPWLLLRARHKCSKDVWAQWKGHWQSWQEVADTPGSTSVGLSWTAKLPLISRMLSKASFPRSPLTLFTEVEEWVFFQKRWGSCKTEICFQNVWEICFTVQTLSLSLAAWSVDQVWTHMYTAWVKQRKLFTAGESIEKTMLRKHQGQVRHRVGCQPHT